LLDGGSMGEARIDVSAIQVCEHVRPVLDYALAQGAKMTYVGTPWSRNCRVWVSLDRVLDLGALREKLGLAAVVEDHVHRGTHDGAEQGLVCGEHHDAVIGGHPEVSRDRALR
jgi:hypothetical protein